MPDLAASVTDSRVHKIFIGVRWLLSAFELNHSLLRGHELLD